MGTIITILLVFGSLLSPLADDQNQVPQQGIQEIIITDDIVM